MRTERTKSSRLSHEDRDQAMSHEDREDINQAMICPSKDKGRHVMFYAQSTTKGHAMAKQIKCIPTYLK